MEWKKFSEVMINSPDRKIKRTFPVFSNVLEMLLPARRFYGRKRIN